MGAQESPGPNQDPRANSYTMPVHDVTLDPFFLSKFEMTQGQWQRFVGHNPSTFVAGKTFSGRRPSSLHPVESVTWHECHEVSRRLGLRLPTEAQW